MISNSGRAELNILNEAQLKELANQYDAFQASEALRHARFMSRFYSAAIVLALVAVQIGVIALCIANDIPWFGAAVVVTLLSIVTLQNAYNFTKI